MKTTLNIDDNVMRELRTEAGRQGRTMSELVEAALRGFLQKRQPPESLPELPTFEGKARVDVGDRGALYAAMEGR